MIRCPRNLSRLAALAPLILIACRPQPADKSSQQTIYAEHRCGGMPSKWGARGAEAGELMTFNRLGVGLSTMQWNGKIINQATLSRYLAENLKLNPQPITVIVPAQGTNCAIVSTIRHIMEVNLQCSVSHHCVEYSEAEWVKIHPRLPSCDADCQAYGRAGGSDRLLATEQKRRLKRNYIDRYGIIPW